jgi:hypothetical protein
MAGVLRCGALLAIGLPAIGLLGCGEQHYRAESIWHADGRVERAIYQPAEALPDEARRGWDVLSPAADIASNTMITSIRDVPEATEPSAPYLVAWGTFLSPDHLPDSFRFGKSSHRVSQLNRATSIRSLGFVVEYTWSEHLTDAVSLADMQAARREAVDLVCGLVEDTLRECEFRGDASRLITWLRTDGAVLFEDLHAVLVESAIRRESTFEKSWQRLADVCARHGLNLRQPDGRLAEHAELEAILKRFLLDRLRDTVRDAKGDVLNDADALELLRQLGFLSSDGALNWEPTEAWRRAVASRFGTEEAATARAEELATRLFGVYRLGFLGPRRPFHYEMTVPGTIVETTGERVAENRVIWRFDAADAFPLGYEMRVRSLAPNEAAQRALLGERRLDGSEKLTRYVSLLRDDPNLAATMAEVIDVGSFQPLDKYETTLRQQAGDSDVPLKRVQALRTLIGP